MKKPPVLGLALLSTALVACAPSINKAAKADVDRRIATIQPTGKSFDAPSSHDPMSLTVGQWTQYKTSDDNNRPGFTTYKIVGEEAGAYWIETVHEDYFGRTVTKMLVALGDRKDPRSMDIRTVKMKNHDGTITEIDPQTMQFMKSMWEGTLANLVIYWEGLPQEDASVPAGSFSRCFKTRTTVSAYGYSVTSDAWAHPSVPINGLVKSQGVDKNFTMELVDFGTSGATSEL
ncbi:MAG: hypothetical protein HY698_06310 [Deltaproteobacteria bacterium]|nr:hypothetical protein [Deltaproteobacteria bacterium]